MKRKQQKVRPILNPSNEGTTFLALGLGEMGFSAQAIANECGLSPGAVYYRLRAFGIQLRDYRTGDSDFSRELRKLAKPLLTKRIRRLVERKS